MASPSPKLLDITQIMRCGGHIDDSIQKQGLRKESVGGGQQCKSYVCALFTMRKPENDVKKDKRVKDRESKL
jgi:hypothetical protein